MDFIPRLQIYHWDFFFLIMGSLRKVPSHSHNAVQIFVDLSGKQTIQVDGSQLCGPIIYINTNVPHSVLLPGDKQFTILIDGDSEAANHFSHHFLKGESYSTDPKLLNYFNSEDHLSIKRQIYDLLSNENCSVCSPSDSRIVKIKEFIDCDEEKKLSLQWLANQVSLSESRLAHLFKEQVGIPLRRYLLWKRLISALKIILDGHNLTYAAHYSGFSDSAHLSRTFKSNFGFNLSKIFKNSRFVQFHSL